MFYSDARQPEVSFFSLLLCFDALKERFAQEFVQNHGQRVQVAHFRLAQKRLSVSALNTSKLQ